ncbi:MAG TPA: hypothetical protein DER33_06675, partial [Syntrophomonas sp.]|nr:hypothetical protein [Syntrophomonas sp.]
ENSLFPIDSVCRHLQAKYSVRLTLFRQFLPDISLFAGSLLPAAQIIFFKTAAAFLTVKGQITMTRL